MYSSEEVGLDLVVTRGCSAVCLHSSGAGPDGCLLGLKCNLSIVKCFWPFSPETTLRSVASQISCELLLTLWSLRAFIHSFRFFHYHITARNFFFQSSDGLFTFAEMSLSYM